VTVPSPAVEEEAVYSFLVGLSPGRMPLTPDAEHVIVHVPEEDSPRGVIRAGIAAAQIAGGSCAMVTSTELLAVEL
jgi:hypothetical protein